MRVVIALGGNALMRAGDADGAEAQRSRIAEAASAIADIARSHDVVLTHGNGPQIGRLAMPSRADAADANSQLPLDVLAHHPEQRRPRVGVAGVGRLVVEDRRQERIQRHARLAHRSRGVQTGRRAGGERQRAEQGHKGTRHGGPRGEQPSIIGIGPAREEGSAWREP